MLENELRKIVGDQNYLTGQDMLSRDEDWGRHSPCAAKALVRPATTDEVSRVLKACHEAGQAIVTHGGRTGLAQGAVSKAGDIILSLERLRGIEDIDRDNRSMTVWAGSPLSMVQDAAADVGLHFALDLGARGTATIGGAIATNAGGLNVIRYGMMREQVLGLEVVLADGTIMSALNGLIKNNSGYDLKHFFVGSEGSLGIVTRATLRLHPAYTDRNTALLATEDYAHVVKILHRLDHDLGGGLLAYEVMWQNFYCAVTGPDTGRKAPMANIFPYYILLESPVINRARDEEYFQEILMGLMEEGLIGDAVIAKSDSERQALWQMREDVESIFKLGPMMNFDVSLPLSHIPDYLGRVENDVKKIWPEAIFIEFGHLGDNNLHLSLSIGEADATEQKKLKKMVYGHLQDFNGAVSAEHGIGLEKIDYLPYSRTEVELSMMRQLKNTFDPKHILNPGKIFERQ